MNLLSKNLYNLCAYLNLPYSSSTLIPQISDFIGTDIFDILNEKINLKILWNQKNKININDLQFSFKYKIIEQNSAFLKLKLSIEDSFVISPHINKIRSSIIDDYIIISEYSSNSNIKIHALISKEEHPLIYSSLDTKNLDVITDLLPLDINNVWNSDLNSLYDKIQSLSYHFSTRKVKEISKFNIEAACNYAEKFALIFNPEYISYEKNGGDCTNFASQIVHAGGVRKTNTWSPYSNAWLRVEELYSYLINTKAGYKLRSDNELERGTLIQFRTPKLGRFFHTGFITHRLADGECLYCCHTYNKLNYPLSQIYPILYPEIRGLWFY